MPESARNPVQPTTLQGPSHSSEELLGNIPWQAHGITDLNEARMFGRSGPSKDIGNHLGHLVQEVGAVQVDEGITLRTIG
eukprot:307079-Amphidinium_carterae.1